MNDTDFWVPAEKQDRLAKVYDCREGQPSVRYLDNNLGIQNDMAYRPAYEAGGAGLASTIDDYAKFTQMLLNGGTYNGVQILRPATVKFLGAFLPRDSAEIASELASLLSLLVRLADLAVGVLSKF